jgi:hypothetical protein
MQVEVRHLAHRSARAMIARSTAMTIAAAMLLVPSVSLARAMDLSDPSRRWVRVAFEVSPQAEPGRTDHTYTFPFLGLLEEGPEPGTIKVTLSGDVVERYLLEGEEPIPESFSDFVWIFDRETGAVKSASVSGTVLRTLDWGLYSTNVTADIHVEMATDRAGGYRNPRVFLGQLVVGYCSESETDKCNLVGARRYDGERGYVNAVGPITVRYAGVNLRTFSPLGEAIFSEIGKSDAPSAPDTILAGESDHRPPID